MTSHFILLLMQMVNIERVAFGLLIEQGTPFLAIHLVIPAHLSFWVSESQGLARHG